MLPRAAVAGARCRSPDRYCRSCARIQQKQTALPQPSSSTASTPDARAAAHRAAATAGPSPQRAGRPRRCSALLLLLSSRCSRPQTAALTPRAHEIDAEKADQPRREARDEMGSRGDSANRLLKAMATTHARGSFTPCPGFRGLECHPEEVPPSERRAAAKRPNPEPRHATCRTNQTRKEHGLHTTVHGASQRPARRVRVLRASTQHYRPTRNKKSATGGLTVIATTPHRTHRRRWWREQEGEERASTGGVQAAVPRPFHPVPAPQRAISTPHSRPQRCHAPQLLAHAAEAPTAAAAAAPASSTSNDAAPAQLQHLQHSRRRSSRTQSGCHGRHSPQRAGRPRRCCCCPLLLLPSSRCSRPQTAALTSRARQ
jgi:hypothetical protein